MKFYSILILSLLIFVSCGKNKEDSKNETNPAKDTVANQQPLKKAAELYTLRYKFNKGDKHKYRVKTSSQNIQTVIADTTLETKIEQSVEYHIDLTVQNVSDDNTAEIKVYIGKILADVDFNGQKIKYDSKFLYSKRERQQFLEYEALKKTPFYVKIDNMGKVLGATNINKLFKNVLEIQQVPDTLSNETKENMKKQLENVTVIPLVQQLFKIIPDYEVGVDSIWQFSYPSTLGPFQIENIATYKISEIIKDNNSVLAKIAATLNAKWNGQNHINENGIDYTFSDPVITGGGTIWFDIDKGMVQKAETETGFTMEVVMETQNPDSELKKGTRRDYTSTKNLIERL